MAQRAASYGEAVLHKKTPDDEALFRFTSQYESASFHSAMKHSLRSYDEKMKNESFFACNTYLVLLFYQRFIKVAGATIFQDILRLFRRKNPFD
ncbi:MAG: hypothetical protein IKA22_10490 [Lentisphaeria bacterium]|nr:hypothetical protein [Lentisphaeria bacterium]